MYLFLVSIRSVFLSSIGLVLLAAISSVLTYSNIAWSQASTISQKLALPDGRDLFLEDSKDYRSAEKKELQKQILLDPGLSNRMDFKAPNVEFDDKKNSVFGTDGVVISGRGIKVQADQGSLDMDSNDAELKGNVVITGQEANIEADSANFNFDTETGNFNSSRFTLEDGGYQFTSDRFSKISENTFQLFDMSASNCGCANETLPWEISADECDITREGYAHAYDATFRFYGVPVFYSPYLGFPAKTERASGLLAPTFGYNSDDGFQYRQPVYMVWNENSDSILTPFTETQTRNGFFMDYQSEFSKYNSAKLRALFSDESPRGDSLRGTSIDGIFDPEIDQERTGLLYSHSWTTAPNPNFSLGYFADVHYVSDNLLLREIEENGIGSKESQYTVSTAALRSTIGQNLSAELVGEYNQALINDQDTQLQRLPTANVDYFRSDRVFGENSYGLRLDSKLSVNSVEFARDEGYDGNRTNIAPSFTVPFRVANIYNSSFNVGVFQTHYSMNDREQVGNTSELLDSSYDRTLPYFSYAASTGVERVFEVEKDSFLTQLTSYGKDNQANYLARVKNTIDPNMSFLYVPDTSQGENPLYDGFDRQGERALLRYGVNSKMLGRFVPRYGSVSDIPELSPRAQDLPEFDATKPMSTFGVEGLENMSGGLMRSGEIRELLTFGVSQGYEFKESEEDNNPAFQVSPNGEDVYNNPGLRPASDIRTSIAMYPTQNFGFSFENYLDPYDGNMSNWVFSTSARSDRGDALRARYFYYRDPTTGQASLSQLEGNAELVLSNSIRAGYYARYNFDLLDPNTLEQKDEDSLIEQKFAVRFIPDCDCWHFDVGIKEASNPDQQSILFSINFGGLGAVDQSLLVDREEEAGTR
jgi:LPS-assembly protein